MKSFFEQNGYVVIQGLLNPTESAFYRQQIQTLSGVNDDHFGEKVFECPDGVSKNREFWPLISHPRIASTLQEIHGGDIRYTQHSDLHAHRTGGWHRDCACRKYGVGPDWEHGGDPYQVVRVAIYLQSYSESQSALGVIPGSHRFEARLTDDEWTIWRRRYQRGSLINRIRRKLGLWKTPDLPDKRMTMWTNADYNVDQDTPSFPTWINTEPGDCIIFDQRLYHSASPIVGPKYAIYLSYSTHNQHAVNHLGYYRHFRKDLGYGDLDPELVRELKQKNLYMSAPPPEEVNGFFRNGTEQVGQK